MGTRCDFYTVDEDAKKLVWVGSYGWDGYPEGVKQNMALNESQSQGNYVKRIVDFLKEKGGYVAGEDGWPWPWDDSGTTDYYYVYYNDKIYVGAWGGELVEWDTYVKYEDDICEEEEGYEKHFSDVKFELPDMSAIKKVDMGDASGVINIGIPKRMSKEDFQGKLNELCNEYGMVASYKIKYKDEVLDEEV